MKNVRNDERGLSKVGLAIGGLFILMGLFLLLGVFLFAVVILVIVAPWLAAIGGIGLLVVGGLIAWFL
jgi:hypothetical protein